MTKLLNAYHYVLTHPAETIVGLMAIGAVLFLVAAIVFIVKAARKESRDDAQRRRFEADLRARVLRRYKPRAAGLHSKRVS